MPDRRLDAGQLQLDPRDGRRWRRPLQASEEEPLDRLGVRGRFGESLVDAEFGWGSASGEAEVERQAEVGAGGGGASSLELIGECPGEAVEDEPERVELPDGGLDRQGECESFRGPPRAERRDLLPLCPGQEARALIPEPGDERRSRQLCDRPDPAQPEASEAGLDVRIGGQERGRQRGEEGRLAVRPDDPWLRRRGMGGRDRRRESGPGDPRPWGAGQDRDERGDEAPDELRLAAPQSLEPVDLDLEQAEGRIGLVGGPGQPGTEPGQRLEGGLDGRRIGLRLGIEERRLRSEPVGAPERDSPPDAERPCGRIRVDDRHVRPGLSAEDDRPIRREGAGEAGSGEPEG